VPRAYDILGPTKELKGEKNENKRMKSRKNLIQDFKNTFFFQKPKFQYKPACEVGNVWEEHIYQSVSS
jgi:hypothetical protein